MESVGQLEAFPGAVNVVPVEAHFSLDLRGEFDDSRDHAWDEISRELDAIMGRRAFRRTAREVHSAPRPCCTWGPSRAEFRVERDSRAVATAVVTRPCACRAGARCRP
ncbi:acetylornithine deacetylase/succinyl-diaminopimelate desuccinylase-like protein [Microbacterium testaceum]|uniref:hypothetical protein n=1 Tax=Microbacterium TaxID=33882 RepID=UPI002780CA63|nr:MULTISPECIES: hypothetical protein [Microbacterium]MDQ1111558.1 acetylornithine deacetylase/succinyl-diaminopimelate desuccinylase-like protein [Microbacterium testaceum]MDR6097907.1 acetylornithine deacetylase/succinyl-diaminopimelate desuccinylase-like protein [Microbacterium sp. SORGH_AS_0454]